MGVSAFPPAYGLPRRDYLHQSYLLAAAVALRLLAFNFFQLSVVGAPIATSGRLYAGTAIALLFAALPFGFALRRSISKSADRSSLDSRPEQVFFFIPFALLTILILLDSTRGQLTVNWGESSRIR